MSVIFHPSSSNIEQNMFGKVTASNLRLLQILKRLEKEKDFFEVYYQPLLGSDRPDFAVVRRGWGIQLIKTCEYHLSDYLVDKDGNYQKRSSDTVIPSPFFVVNASHSALCNDSLTPFLLFSSSKNNPRELEAKQQSLYKSIRCSVYFNSPISSVKSLYKNTRYCLSEDCYGQRNFDKNICFCGKDDSDDEIYQQLLSAFRKCGNVFSERMEEIFRCLMLSEDRMDTFAPCTLTDKQRQFSLSTPGERHKIYGCAGSGKTLTLASRALSCFGKKHQKVLVLYFNITLGSYIQSKIFQQNKMNLMQYFPDDAFGNCFELWNYDAFLSYVARQCGISAVPLEQENNQDFWRERITGKLRERKQQYEQDGMLFPEYETILVDEIQDFYYDKSHKEKSWLYIIEELFLSKRGELVVFGDQKQNVYGQQTEESGTPYTPGISGAWGELPSTFRLSSAMLKVAGSFQKEFPNKGTLTNVPSPKLALFNGGFGFADPSVVNRAYSPHFFMECFRSFILEYHLNLNDICILAFDLDTLRSLHDEIQHNFSEFQVIYDFETQEEYENAKLAVEIQYSNMHKQLTEQEKKKKIDQEKRIYNRQKKIDFQINHPDKNAVKLSTIYSFKGQESSTVVLLLTDPLMQTSGVNSLIYTAITRAKVNLVVFDAVTLSSSDSSYPLYSKYKEFFRSIDLEFRNS